MTRKGLAGLLVSSALIALMAALLAPANVFSQATTCAVVKLQISQQATLERQAFTADLNISNNLPTTPLTSLKVQITVTDSNNNPATQSFFIKTTTVTGTNAVDGTGVIQSSSSADINWLIIPSSGTGGSNPAGQRYGISALITAVSAGVPQNVQTFQAFITVNPQPVIKLEYALPYEVFGEEPLLLPNIITPVVPFPLAVRATNVGFGPANDFQIQSAQPVILDNAQGLPVDFQLIGTNVGGKTIPNTLLIPFGTIAPNAVSQAYWYMTATLSGQFSSFTSTFTHAADLGGQLTSLLQSVNTYTLLSNVLVDLPGRDNVPDFLVNETASRTTMQTTLDGGAQPPAQYILESDQPNPLPVAEITGGLAGTLGGTNAALTFNLTQAVSSNVWVHSYVAFPQGANLAPSYAQRSDGKVLNPANVWVSKHFVKSSLQYIYWLNLLDLTSSATSYTISFSSSGLDLPPGAVTSLAAVTSSSAGAVNLTWTAPGEDGYSGYLFGGHYFIDGELSPYATNFAPANAQVTFTTSTPPGAAQYYTDTGLVGNVTYYLRLWTQDTGGNMSPISNAATAYTLPDPPTNLVISSVTGSEIALNWQLGNNNIPIVYQVWAATTPFGAVVSSSPYQDSFHRSAILTGLSPSTSYFILGAGINPATNVTGPPAVLGSTVTPGGGQDVLPPRTNLVIGAPNYYGPSYPYASTTTFFSLLAVDDFAIVGDSVGVGVARTYIAIDTTTFSLYYATNTITISTEGLHTFSFYSVDLDSHAENPNTQQVAIDSTPPSTTLMFMGNEAADSQGGENVSSNTYISLNSIDPLSHGVASGIDTIFFYVDVDPTQAACQEQPFVSTAPAGSCANPDYSVPFQLSGGIHSVYYFAEDNVANQEIVNVTTFSVQTDALPPRTTLAISTPDFVAPAAVYASSLTVFSLTAVSDGISVGDGAGPGIARTYVAVDAAGYSPYSGPFSLAVEGPHNISFYSVDLASNVEVAHSTEVAVDNTPPVTTLSWVGISSYTNQQGVLVVSTDTLFVLTSTDPVSNGVSSGLDTIFYYIDADPTQAACQDQPFVSTAPAGSCANPDYNGAFPLQGGPHTVYYFAEDNVNNQEAVNVISIAVDDQPPVTTIAIDGIAQSTTTLTITSTDTVGFVAVDTTAGVAQTFYDVDFSSFSPYSSPFALIVGTHTLAYYSVNNLGDVEPVNNAFITVKSTGSASPTRPILTAITIAPSSATLLIGATQAFTAIGTFSNGTISYSRPLSANSGWATPAPMPTPRAELMGGVVRGVLYAMGGEDINGNSLSVIEAYNIAAGTWTTLTPMPWGRSMAFSAVYNNKIYIMGGCLGGTNACGGLNNRVDIYDPATQSWSSGAPAPVPNYFGQAAELSGRTGVAMGSKIYVPGGFANMSFSTEMDIYDPVADAWTVGPAMPTAHYGAGVAALGTKIYVIGGDNPSGDISEVDVYDIVSGAWSVGPPLSSTRFGLSAAVLQGKVHALGGRANSGLATTIDEVYDPATNAWTLPDVMTNTHEYFAAFADAARIYALGGFVDTPTSGDIATLDVLSVQEVSWASNAPSIATVTSTGLATGLSTGTARVSASSGTISGSALVSVRALDDLPPRTTLSFGTPSFSSAPFIYATNATTFSLSAVDDASTIGDGAGAGVAQTYIAIDTTTFSVYAGTFSLNGEGLHSIQYYSVDLYGNTEIAHSLQVAVDLTPPITTLSAVGVSTYTNVQGTLIVSTDTVFSLSAIDPISNGVASGVGVIYYVIDDDLFSDACFYTPYDSTQPPGTCANPDYAGAFTLAAGTHTVYSFAADNVDNQELENVQPVVVAAASPLAINPSTGPIGIPFTITGSGFGSYSNSNTRVRFGATLAPLTVWTDTTISGSIPGLSTGTYPVFVEIQTGANIADTGAGLFTVFLPSVTALSPPSGPIGTPFTLSGAQFGPYNNAATTVLIGGVSAPLSLWNDTAIMGTIPYLSSGTQTVVVQRTTPDGGLAASTTFYFNVTAPTAAPIAPSSGPIGMPFTISGAGFGSYNNAYTRVLIGGTTAPLSSWTNTAITGTIPGLSTGTYAVSVVIQAGIGMTISTAGSFAVITPALASITPSSGPIGVVFTLSGAGFGPYNNAATVVLMGGATTALSLWTDTTITGSVPGSLVPGSYPVVVVRTTPDGGYVQSSSAAFTVTGISVAALTPSTGPIGIPFTISGSGFGAYNNSNTRVRFGPLLAPLSQWTDTTISGSVPGLSTGTYCVKIEIQSGSNVAVSTVAVFTVFLPSATALSPPSGPIGTPFTLTGSYFGPYNNTATVVLMGGTTAALSAWSDTSISGSVPGNLTPGSYPVIVARTTPDGGYAQSSSTTFTVTGVSGVALSPSTGPIGIPFTISGNGFGTYNNAYTRVLIGGATAPLSSWTNTAITGTIPGLSTGTYCVQVVIQAGSNVTISTAGYFTVITPAVASLTPNSGPIGVSFTLSGAGFGPYNNAATVVLFGTTTAQLSAWTDTAISGSVPGIPSGTYAVVVERTTPDGGLMLSSSATFTIAKASISSINPSTATPGTSFTITGAGFGPYNNGNTQVLFSTTPAALSAWTDSTIQGTVPNVAFGTTTVAVSIQAGAAVAISTVAFDVVAPNYVFNSTDGVVTLNSANASETVTPIPPPSQSNAYAIATSTEENEVVGSFYELSPSGNVFNPPATIQFSFDPANTDTATLTIYTFNGVAWDSSSIVNQQITILSPSQGVISGTLYHASLYGAIHRHRRLRVGILSPKGPGFAGQIKGTIPVLGYASGLSLADWTLDFAPGQDARSGFTTIASGASAVSTGTLASWNAAGLSGWQTLRLSAKSVHGKSASVSENVYVGDPSLLSEINQNLKAPTGVAIGPSGLAYVADTGNNRIDVFSSLGTLTASFPAATGQQPFSLRSPEGVATDFFGNIYVADTGGRRALKLTSLGTVALSIPLHGKPVGIAVDAAGYIYVSDQSDAAVLKFDAAGGKLLTFSLPQSKPAGIALDAKGNLYVVDPKKRRLAVFSSSGTLINTFGSGLALDRPYGVAVTPSGATIVVSDMASDRVESIDALGRATSVFGGPRSGLSGPRGLAFDANGELYLAERPLNKILKLGPPIPGMAPVPFANPLALLGQDDAYIAAAAGGRLQRPDGASLTIPPGALADDMDCSISTPAVRLQAEEDLKNRKLANDNLIAVSTGAVFGPEGTALTTFAELCVPYDAAAVAALGVPELRLKIYGWNPNKQDWFWIPARTEPAKRVVCGRALSLGLYRVMMRKDGL